MSRRDRSEKELDPEDRCYRDVLDALVTACREGQGAIGARRARAGVWNPNATATSLVDQHERNQLLSALTPAQRETLAQMLSEQFAAGVHQALVTLHAEGIAPFDASYEGSPFHDFVGRLGGWSWPEEGERLP
ncbi:MAG: hypothetical protein H6721_29135 [Sandaracinus sp.]|nr:hypothetical protein [Sandaracinus sp.]MCB9624615.1 hypothetical protein [Sandaracinus sp.]MCB9636195.1 hypothetical protein [Sandaracinus sp.]